jgi:hypothetical protein
MALATSGLQVQAWGSSPVLLSWEWTETAFIDSQRFNEVSQCWETGIVFPRQAHQIQFAPFEATGTETDFGPPPRCFLYSTWFGYIINNHATLLILIKTDLAEHAFYRCGNVQQGKHKRFDLHLLPSQPKSKGQQSQQTSSLKHSFENVFSYVSSS